MFCQFSWGTFRLILCIFAGKCDFLPEIISENMIFLLIFAAENLILRVRNYYHNEIKYEKKKDMDCCRVSYVLHGSTGARDEGAMHVFGLHSLQNHSHRGNEDVIGGIQ